ncbi:hypothetical protein BH10BAC2_BH10BAC2_23120 [soil metagenome]
MLQETCTKLFERDLNRLEREVSAYTNEADLWKSQPGIANTGGNLCLHLVGNLKNYIGKNLGGIAYERNREREFADKDIPKDQLLKSIMETKEAVLSSISRLTTEDMAKIYPEEVLGSAMTTEYFLVHLYGHLNYHLGQINYHRRLLNQ